MEACRQGLQLHRCACFVVMRRLGITTAASPDEDFARDGFRMNQYTKGYLEHELWFE
jgi:hypothetical protein